MTRQFKLTVATLPLLLVAAGIIWLIASTSGSQWLLSRAAEHYNINVNYQRLQGSLISGLSTEQLSLRANGLDWQSINCRQCNFNWNPWPLLQGKISVTQLAVNNLTIQLSPSIEAVPASNKSPLGDLLPAVHSIQIPIVFDIKNIELKSLSINRERESLFELATLTVDVKAYRNHIELNNLSGVFEENSWSGAVSLHLKQNPRATATLDLPTHLSPLDNHETLRLNATCLQQTLECDGVLRYYIDSILKAPQLGKFTGQTHWNYRDNKIKANLSVQLKPSDGGALAITTPLDINIASGELTLENWQLTRGSAAVKGSALLNVANTFHASGDFQVQQLSAQTLAPFLSLPKLSANALLSSQGQFHYSASGSQIELGTIDIQSGARHLTGRAQFNIEPCDTHQCWSVPYAKLNGERNQLSFSASGRDELVANAKLAVKVDEWQHWPPDTHGDIDLQAQWQNNNLALRVHSNSLQWQQWFLSQWKLNARGNIDNIHHWPSWHWQTLKANASIAQGDQQLGNWQLSGSGSAKQHQVNLSLTTDDKGDLTLGALRTGALKLQGALDTKTFNWNGQLQQLSLLFQNNQRWRQRQPTQLQLSEQQQQWQSLCLDHDNSKATLCVEPGGMAQQQGSLKLALKHWSLNRNKSPAPQFYSQLDSAWSPEGELGLEAEFNMNGSDLQASGKLWSDSAKLTFTDGDNEPLQWSFAQSQALWQLQNQHLNWQAEMHSSEQDQLHSHGDFNLDTQMISAEITGDWQQLQSLQPLVSDVDQLRGELSADLTFAGKIQEPELNGALKLHKVHFVIPATGTEVSDAEVQLNIAPSSLNINANANVGEGKAELSGSLLGPLFTQSAEANKTLDIRLNGRNMNLIKRPNLSLNSDTNLQLKGNNRELKLSGLLAINNSNLTLEQLPTTATRVSPDQIVLGREHEQQQLIPVDADIQLRVGDQVRFKGFGLDTHLKGDLRITQNGDTHVNGALELYNGFYQRFSQRLDIEQGQLLFTGEMDNPILRVRAEQKFTEATVGVEVRGSAAAPESRLYSNPSMSDADRLAYLISGKPMGGSGDIASNELQNAAIAMGMSKAMPTMEILGEKFGLTEVGLESDSDNTTALALGKKLNDQIYIKYLYGLINNSARLVMEYRINNNLSIEASSGDTQAVDVRYRWQSELRAQKEQ